MTNASTVSPERDIPVPADQVLLSLPDAGRILGVSRGTVRNLILREQLRPVQFLGVQRIPRREIDRLLSDIGAL